MAKRLAVYTALIFGPWIVLAVLACYLVHVFRLAFT